MSTAKFEKLIDLIINEDQERAEQLFHEIVVEKSREIYESIIDEDMTTDMIDEISAEEEGMDEMMEEEDEFIDDEEISGDYDVEGEGEEDFGGDEEVDFDMDDVEGEGEGEGLEDRVVDLEDKLDELMAEFESLMGDQEGQDDEEDMEVDMDVEDEDEVVAESAEMKKVSVTHTDGSDSSSGKTPVAANSGQRGMASRPVNFDQGGGEAVPTSPKKPSNYGTKGEGEVKGAASFKNKVGGDTSTGKGKGESAPKPVSKQPAGGDQRSPVPESRRTTKRRV